MTRDAPPRPRAGPDLESGRVHRATLDALAAQTFPGLEFLISDDASPDDTAAICERRAARGPALSRDPPAAQPRLGRERQRAPRVRRAPTTCCSRSRTICRSRLRRACAWPHSRPIPTRCWPSRTSAWSARTAPSRNGPTRGSTASRTGSSAPGASRGSRARGGSPTAACSAPWRRARSADSAATPAGEFSADWPWLLEMSLLGGFVRIPERLVTKFYLPDSLSRSWRFGARHGPRSPVSAMTAVSRRRLPLRDELRLRAALAGFVLRQFRRSVRPAMGPARPGR